MVKIEKQDIEKIVSELVEKGKSRTEIENLGSIKICKNVKPMDIIEPQGNVYPPESENLEYIFSPFKVLEDAYNKKCEEKK